MVEIERHVVSAILWTDDGRVLLQQRDDRQDLRFPGYWTLFGGLVEEGESPDEAIERELMEELGLDGQPLTPFEQYICPARSTPGVVVTTNHVYSGRLAQPIESLVLCEGQVMALMSCEQAGQVELAFMQTPVLERWFAWVQAQGMRDRSGLHEEQQQ
ncbi:MAG: NUDIX domain-containing protein [Anaerolineae bacterium]|nr:NUDIX domain-containing protein [Anaerolineae bacterium]